MNESIFEGLGIYGYRDVEDLILAGLVTGDPVLLVGTHGTAKTLLCETLAQALNLKFIAYDASKALFEDILGFPLPPSGPEEKKVKYIPTSISIFDKEFVLIDEISRANPSMQSKWLEIIRSRRIMGERVRTLKYIFAAMNPPWYPGARTLDPALSGRFPYIVQVPEFHTLPDEEKQKVIFSVSGADAVMLKELKRTLPEKESAARLRKVIAQARSEFSHVKAEYSQVLSDFIIRLSKKLQEHFEDTDGFRLDGRRAAMIQRSIIAIMAVKKAKGQKVSDFAEFIYRIIPHLVPFPVEAEEFPLDTFMMAVEESLVEPHDDGKFNAYKKHVDLTRMFTAFQQAPSVKEKISQLFKIASLAQTHDLQFKTRLYRFLASAFSIPLIGHLAAVIDVKSGHRPSLFISKSYSMAVRIQHVIYESNRFSAYENVEELAQIIEKIFQEGKNAKSVQN